VTTPGSEVKKNGNQFFFSVEKKESPIFIAEEAKKKLLSSVSFVFSREREEMTRSCSFTTFHAFFQRLRCPVFLSCRVMGSFVLDRCLNFPFFFFF